MEIKKNSKGMIAYKQAISEHNAKIAVAKQCAIERQKAQETDPNYAQRKIDMLAELTKLKKERRIQRDKENEISKRKLIIKSAIERQAVGCIDSDEIDWEGCANRTEIETIEYEISEIKELIEYLKYNNELSEQKLNDWYKENKDWCDENFN